MLGHRPPLDGIRGLAILGVLMLHSTIWGAMPSVLPGGNLGVTQSYIADVTAKRLRDRAFAAFGVVFGAGIVLGPVLGGALVHVGFWLPFVAAAGIELINIGLTLRFLPATGGKRRRIDIPRTAREIWSEPRIRSLIAQHFLFIFAVTFFFAIFSLYLRRVLDFGPEQTSYLIATAGVVGGIALWIGVGPLAERFGDAFVARLGLALSVAAYALLGFAHQFGSFVAVLVIWAIGAACIEPTISALLSNTIPEGKRGAALGFNDMMSNVGLMLAPPLGGFVVDKSVGLIGAVPGAAVLAALVLSLRTTSARRAHARPGRPTRATE